MNTQQFQFILKMERNHSETISLTQYYQLQDLNLFTHLDSSMKLIPPMLS